MKALKITVTDAAGKSRTISDFAPGLSLMDVCKQNGVEGVLGNCGGGAACGTCHVYVDPAWEHKLPDRDEIEAEMLDLIEDTCKANSRLGCQIRVDETLNGLMVTVAPPSDY